MPPIPGTSLWQTALVPITARHEPPARLSPARLVEELRANAPLLAGTAAGVGAGLAIGAADGRDNWPVYLVVLLLGAALVIVLHLRYRFSLATRIGLAVFALSHVAGGMLTVGDDVLYRWWLLEPILRYDNIQHAWGFGFAGRAMWEMLGSRLGPESRTPLIAWWIVVLAAGAIGASNEIVEWILTLTIPGTDVGGYDNTARDLVANLVGGSLVGLWTARHVRSGDSPARQS